MCIVYIFVYTCEDDSRILANFSVTAVAVTLHGESAPGQLVLKYMKILPRKVLLTRNNLHPESSKTHVRTNIRTGISQNIFIVERPVPKATVLYKR